MANAGNVGTDTQLFDSYGFAVMSDTGTAEELDDHG